MGIRQVAPSDIGARVSLLRRKADLSARALDKAAGITPGHTSLIERVLGNRISAQTLAQIARVLGTTVDWLISGTGREPSAADVQRAVARARAKAA